MREILDNITFFCDEIRIVCGDSYCPLFRKCLQKDEDNDCCVSLRGREEVGGSRAPCYLLNKKWIIDNKIGVLGRALRQVLNLLVSIGGDREEKTGT